MLNFILNFYQIAEDARVAGEESGKEIGLGRFHGVRGPLVGC
jgi:hypothetical protein